MYSFKFLKLLRNPEVYFYWSSCFVLSESSWFMLLAKRIAGDKNVITCGGWMVKFITTITNILSQYLIIKLTCNNYNGIFTVIFFFHQQSLKSVHLKSRSWVHSEKQENQSKNRFNNIVACKFSTLKCMLVLQVYIYVVEDQYNEPPYIRQTPAPHFHSICGRGQEYYSIGSFIREKIRRLLRRTRLK